MTRLVPGPQISGVVYSKQTGAPLAGVTVTPSAALYTTPEFTTPVSTLTTDGEGGFAAYAQPGVYTFTISDSSGVIPEPVEVRSPDQGTSPSATAAGMTAAIAAEVSRSNAAYGPRAASVVVAASDSAHSGTQVDFVCTGTNDQVTINAAIAALPVNGGKVLLLAGTYYLGGSVVVNRKSVILRGEGLGYWNEYVGGIPTASAGEGLGMSKLKATAATFPLIKIDNTVMSGSGASARLNGIEISNFYLYGASKSATTSVGIFCNDDGRPTDFPLIHNLMIHNVYDGIIINADTMSISRCSIQDIGHHGISIPQYGSSNPGSTFTTVYPRILENCIADIGGDCINIGSINAAGAVIAHNTLARGQHGVVSGSGAGLITDNQFISQNDIAVLLTGGWNQVSNNQFESPGALAVELNGCVGGQVINNNFQTAFQSIVAFNAGSIMIAHNQIRTTFTGDEIINLFNVAAAMVDHNQVWLTSGSTTHAAIKAATATGNYSGNIARGTFSTAPYNLPANDGTTVINQNNLSYAS